MRAVIQRVSAASVTVDGQIVGEVGRGFLVLLGVTHDDTVEDSRVIAGKLVGLRVFTDENDFMNLSLSDVGGSVLLVSQFTLYADAKKGRRPSFVSAARPEVAGPLVDFVRDQIESHGAAVATGTFGAHMDVALHNDGPVTILLETRLGRLI